MLKRNISDVFSHKYMEIKIISDIDLRLVITLNLVINVAKFVKSIFDENYNQYYYQIVIQIFSFEQHI